MQLCPVSSSNLRAVGYDGISLVILFHSGRRYRFSGVPAWKYEELMSASSKGGYFAAHIRHLYPYERVS